MNMFELRNRLITDYGHFVRSFMHIQDERIRVLRHGSGRGVQALVVYPMNALANSQEGELEKFLCRGYPNGKFSDSSEVWIRPNGEVVRLPQREYDAQGQRTNKGMRLDANGALTATHTTGERVEN